MNYQKRKNKKELRESNKQHSGRENTEMIGRCKFLRGGDIYLILNFFVKKISIIKLRDMERFGMNRYLVYLGS